jgi:IS5 family transposase
MRFCGLALHDAVPGAKTIWLYREQLTKAGAIEGLFARRCGARAASYPAMGGPIVDVTAGRAAAAQAQCGREGDGQGRSRPRTLVEGEAVQMDTGGRRTIKPGRRDAGEGAPVRGAEIAVPVFGLQEPSEHRPPARLHSDLRHDRCRRTRWPPARPPA